MHTRNNYPHGAGPPAHQRTAGSTGVGATVEEEEEENGGTRDAYAAINRLIERWIIGRLLIAEAPFEGTTTTTMTSLSSLATTTALSGDETDAGYRLTSSLLS